MNTPTTRVAIVTGASQGIGEALVAGYRRLGYGHADFTRPDGTVLALMLGVALTRDGGDWRIAQYQVSAVPA